MGFSLLLRTPSSKCQGLPSVRVPVSMGEGWFLLHLDWRKERAGQSQAGLQMSLLLPPSSFLSFPSMEGDRGKVGE